MPTRSQLIAQQLRQAGVTVVSIYEPEDPSVEDAALELPGDYSVQVGADYLVLNLLEYKNGELDTVHHIFGLQGCTVEQIAKYFNERKH